MGSPRLHLEGQRFGRWTVLRRHSLGSNPTWMCRCDCGVTRPVQAPALRSGVSQSCGCLHREIISKKMMKHGHHTLALRNGTKEYRAWKDAKARCHNSKHRWFKNYGALGVTVCDRWRESFKAFLADMGPCAARLTLDRVDPFGNYEPMNCRWADWATQGKNQRRHHVSA